MVTDVLAITYQMACHGLPSGSPIANTYLEWQPSLGAGNHTRRRGDILVPTALQGRAAGERQACCYMSATEGLP
jgi:hypothetical protein